MGHYCIIKGKDEHPKMAKLCFRLQWEYWRSWRQGVLKVKREQGWLIEVWQGHRQCGCGRTVDWTYTVYQVSLRPLIIPGFFSSIFYLFVHLFIWPCWVLVAAHGSSLFVVACKIFWGMWAIVPRPGIEPGRPALGVWRLSHWATRESPAETFLNVSGSMFTASRD